MKWILAFLMVIQLSPSKDYSKKNSLLKTAATGLFEASDVLHLTLSGNLNSAFKDRQENPVYHTATLSYKNEDSTNVSLSINIKTRGHFRKTMGNCIYPPLMLQFPKENTPEGTLFAGQDKLKLVTPCMNDEYVIREYLVYKIYNLITEKSFRARLVKVVYDDAEKQKKSKALYGILLEDEDQMARRNNSIIEESQLLLPQQTNRDTFLNMAVFEYLIANTDWSVQYRQNIKLINNQTGDLFSTVPYDFDHAGIVSAPYAKPAAELQLGSVRERRFRGYCLADVSQLNGTFKLFDDLKTDIYRIYSDNPLLDEKYKKNTLKFLDEFYSTIHDEKARNTAFGYPCRKDGTGNVVIKGLAK